MASVFTKIIKGDLPCYRVYEDDHTLAFLTLEAIQTGHTLVVPKTEVDYFVDVPEPYYSAVFKAAKPIAKAIHQATKCNRVATMIAGWDVPHFHYHIVPTYDPSDLSFSKARQRSDSENQAIQTKIVNELKKVLASSS